MAANQNIDVLVCAHTGFEGAANFVSFWKGSLIGKKIYVNFWRIQRGAIPKETHAYTNWLYDLWSDVDQWIDKHIEDS